MGEQDSKLTGPDLAAGVSITEIREGGMLAGHAQGEAVLLARVGSDWFAISATCSHYSGPLPEGLLVGDTVRCPWHHACFSLRTGQALRPPALNDLACWQVEQRDGKVFVTAKARKPSKPEGGRPTRRDSRGPESVVIVGAGAAGDSAAETLRREGYEGRLTLYDPDPDAPYDRPNLSKDYLAGTASEDWIPLHPPEFYQERGISIVHDRRVMAIEPKARRIRLDDGQTREYGALLLATGATPIRLAPEMESGGPPSPLSAQLRRQQGDRRRSGQGQAGGDSRRELHRPRGGRLPAGAKAGGARGGAGPPAARAGDGPELGDFVRRLHEEHGVIFHLRQTAKTMAGGTVTLESGERLAADFVVAGIGVRPNLELAERAGLTIDRGVVVDQQLQTSAPGIFAAGDIARWPDPHTGERIRVEHWVVAQRQGQAAARSMLGQGSDFDAVPFFWSQHYDVPINYVGHAERWDSLKIEGSVEDKDCAVRFVRENKTLAVATIYRDRQSLEAEAEMERAAR